jgi:hypothetical protein
MPGRIKIEVEGVLIDERPWFTVRYLKNIINDAQVSFENAEITITTDEQSDRRRTVTVGRRGVGDIIYPGTDEVSNWVRRSA